MAANALPIVGLLAEHYGRGPIKAKTHVLDDLVVCVLRNGFTAIEETMIITWNSRPRIRSTATSLRRRQDDAATGAASSAEYSAKSSFSRSPFGKRKKTSAAPRTTAMMPAV